MSNIETSGSALASGSIAARFVTQDVIDEAASRREQEWKEAYARIGQEPPKLKEELPYDGRTLFERLEEQRILKQEEWDNKMKLSNQYRGLETDELNFLADKVREHRAEERRVEEEDNVQVQSYREAIAKRNADLLAASEPQLDSSSSARPASASASAALESASSSTTSRPAAAAVAAGSASASSTETAASVTGKATTNPSTGPVRVKPVKKGVKALVKGLVVSKSKKPAAGAGVKRAAESGEGGDKKRKI